MLVALHWWPPDVEFGLKELNTVASILERQAREHGRR